jgi:signal transduction histidine kinase
MTPDRPPLSPMLPNVPTSRASLRLVPDALDTPSRLEAIPQHPLTTPSAPLLPSREAAGQMVDIWEEVDRASAWVCDEIAAGRLCTGPVAAGSAATWHEQVRHALRLLCVASRAAWSGAGNASRVAAALPIRREDLPAHIPASELAGALRRRLVAQTIDAREAGHPSADPADVLQATAALHAVEAAIAGDGVRSVVDQLTGASAMDLLVEVAHDMRSPLGSMLFLVERLRAAQLPPAEDRQLALVYGAAFGLSSMVSDVMELARGGDRLAAGDPSPFVVAEVLDAVRAIVAPLAEEKGLTLRVTLPPRDVRLGQGAALHRVLVNLVTNALKFTPAGEVAVTVTPCSRTRLAFVIADTGRGIPPRVLAQLFQTFRLRASGEDYAFSSAGLGLAICQRLLGAMDSELEVESVEGVGTTFRFVLDLPPDACGVA